MVLQHVVGLLVHPRREWEAIRGERCTVSGCYLRHVVPLAAIPPVCAYVGATAVGWSVAGGDPVRMTAASALPLAVAFYAALLAGVYIMGRAIHWMAGTYGARADLGSCVVLAAYTAVPLFLAGIAALWPQPWLMMLVGLAAVGYAVYLFYTGVPVMMGISREQGFLMASAALTVGLVLLVGMLAVTVLLWGLGLAPVFTPGA